MRARLAGWLIAVQFPCILAAQQAEVVRYDVADGLPQSMVNHVLQDSDGFIWLGTGDGLARFDGSRFRVWKHDPADPTSLTSNPIWGLAEADADHLWVGSRFGLDRLDRRTGHVQRIRTGAPHTRDGCWVPLMRHAGAHLLYSPLTSSLLRISAGDTLLRRLRHHPSYAVQADPRDGSITMAIANDTLLRIDPHGRETITVLPLPARHRPLHDLIPLNDSWLLLASDGVWTWSEELGLRELPGEAGALCRQAGAVKRAARAPDGRIWMGLSGFGVVVLDEKLAVERIHPLLPDGERPLEITCVVPDRQGNIWVGTDGKGVFRIAPQAIKFQRCMPGQGLPWEPPSWFVRGLAQWDPHRVLVSLYPHTLALFDERTATLAPFAPAGPLAGVLQSLDLRRPFNDRYGHIWGQDHRTAIAMDPASGILLFKAHRPWGISVVPGPDGHALLFDRHQVLRMRRANGQWRPDTLPMPNLLRYLEEHNGIPMSIAMLRDGTVLVPLTAGELSAWRQDERVTLAGLEPGVQMTSVAEGADGRIWLTTNAGLYELDRAGLGVLRRYTIHNGLPDQFIYGMLPDGPEAWWLSTNNGLVRFNATTGTFIPYGVPHGIQSREFNSFAFFRSASGRHYFGGINGFNHFMPGERPRDADAPQVRVVGLSVQDTATAVPAAATAIPLPYGRNHVRLELAVLEMSAPERNRYRYRVPGYSDWREQPADRPIELLNLPDGTWVVEVVGLNADGTESAPTEVLRLFVPLPFRASPWAFVLGGALAAVVIGGLAFGFYRQRLRVRMAIAEQEMRELRVRARIAQDLHDDVGSGLARITALARTAASRSARGEAVSEQAGRVSALSQELMQELRDVVWVNDPRGGTLADLLLRIRGHVSDLFADGAATVVFRFPEPLPERPIGGKARRELYLIAKEAAHNAFKHSGASLVEVSFRCDADGFELALVDNGRGMAPQCARGDGHGLGNMRARAEELGCTLRITETATGLRISVAGPPDALDL